VGRGERGNVPLTRCPGGGTATPRRGLTLPHGSAAIPRDSDDSESLQPHPTIVCSWGREGGARLKGACTGNARALTTRPLMEELVHSSWSWPTALSLRATHLHCESGSIENQQGGSSLLRPAPGIDWASAGWTVTASGEIPRHTGGRGQPASGMGGKGGSTAFRPLDSPPRARARLLRPGWPGWRQCSPLLSPLPPPQSRSCRMSSTGSSLERRAGQERLHARALPPLPSPLSPMLPLLPALLQQPA
jgi:hypothetical protein